MTSSSSSYHYLLNVLSFLGSTSLLIHEITINTSFWREGNLSLKRFTYISQIHIASKPQIWGPQILTRSRYSKGERGKIGILQGKEMSPSLWKLEAAFKQRWTVPSLQARSNVTAGGAYEARGLPGSGTSKADRSNNWRWSWQKWENNTSTGIDQKGRWIGKFVESENSECAVGKNWKRNE